MMLRRFINDQRGNATLYTAIGGLLLLVAYMLYPDPFHDFVKFIINTILDSVRDAFGTDGKTLDNGPGRNGEGQLQFDGNNGGQSPDAGHNSN